MTEPDYEKYIADIFEEEILGENYEKRGEIMIPKMTLQEAKDELMNNNFILLIQINLAKSEKGRDILNRKYKVNSIAISALEKQIAEKPTAKHSDNIFTGMDGTCLVCPSCEKRIINVWNRAEYKPNYCHYCGQALDWSDS